MRRHAGYSQDGFVARLDPSLRGYLQLTYSTLLGGSSDDFVHALTLDDRGVAVVVGETSSSNFPTTADGWDTSYNGGPYQDAFIAKLDLLPTGVQMIGASSPGCDGPLAIGVTSIPSIGNSQFAVTCTRAPPNTRGEILIGTGVRTRPIRVVGVDVWLDPLLSLPTDSNGSGASRLVLAIPHDAQLIGVELSAQFCWMGPMNPPPCPPAGFSTSNALRIEIQPVAAR